MLNNLWKFLLFFLIHEFVFINITTAEIFNIKSVVKNIKYELHPYNYHPKETDDPIISAISFRSLSDHRIDYESDFFDTDKIKKGDSIYVAYHLLSYFTNEIHPKIKHPYVLITNESTANYPQKNAYILIYDPKCAAWFSKNMVLSNHPKLFQIPVGQTCFEWRDIKPVLPYLIDLSYKENEKLIFAFMRIENTFLKTRKQAIDALKNKPFITFIKHYIQPAENYYNIAHSKFVIAPLGGGYDTCRFWESFMLKSIPITTHSPLDLMYKDIPCVIVDDWYQVNEDFLKKKYIDLQKRLKEGGISFDKAYFGYWKNLIFNVQKKIRDNAWDGASLKSTMLDQNKILELKKLLKKSPCNNLFIIGKNLSLRMVQYSSLLKYTKIKCLDEYFTNKNHLKNYSKDISLSSLKKLNFSNNLNDFCKSILNSKSVHVIFDLYYYQYNFLTDLKKIWNNLPENYVIIITNIKNDYVEENIQKFIKIYKIKNNFQKTSFFYIFCK